MGDFLLANARIRVVIEDARPSDGYDPYGCSIAAADRTRAPGEAGQSRFGEIWLGLNFRAANCSHIAVINDGRDGEAAVIRAEGVDDQSPFMASLFPQASQPADLHATIIREYSLAPDQDAVRYDLIIRNDGNADLFLNKPFVGMAMNRGLRHWVDKSGFDFDFSDLARVNTQAEFYAAVGDDVSYSVFNFDAPFSPILNFAHVLIGQYPEVHIAAGQARTFHFALAVGTGDTGSLQAAHGQLRGAQSDLLPLSGKVVDGGGLPVAHARVHITNAAGDQSLAFARTAADGTWSAPMRTGSYAVRALADDRPGSPVQTVSVAGAGLTGVSLTLGAPSLINAVATDAAGKPLPAKIVLEPNGAGRPTLPAPLGELWNRQPIVIFSADGKATVPVFPAQWHVTFSRGFEYDKPAQDVTAPAGGVATAAQTLHRVVDTTGWVSGDFHIHAQYSPDGDDLLPLKVRAFAAEGVEVPISTEHEFIGDFGPAVRAQLLDPFMHTLAGTELTTTYVGHFNVFPLLAVTGQQNNGGFLWYERNLPDVFAEARARLTPQGLAPIIQMNHPRAAQMGYLDSVGFDPNTFQANAAANIQHWSPDWDAMEVWNGESLQVFEGCPVITPYCQAQGRPQGKDWMAFLNRGRRVAGMGNSDSHNAALREVGYPRTYLQVGVDDPALLTDAQIMAAIRAMKATISGGPFVTVDVGGVGIGQLAQPVLIGSTWTARLHVTVQAPDWMGPLSRLDIWQGDASSAIARVALSDDLSTLPVTPVKRLDKTYSLAVTADTWFLVTVRGPVDGTTGISHALWPVVQTGMPPFSITNPIFIDFNADGLWTPIR